MRVNVVSYLSYEGGTGGAGMTARAFMAEGVRRGHDLRFTHMRPRAEINTHRNPALWLLANVWNLAWHWKRIHRRIWSWIPWSARARYKRILSRASKSGAFVHVDNAYADVCDLPYLPCNGSVVGTECPFKKGF